MARVYAGNLGRLPAYYDPLKGERLKSGAKLGQEYLELSLPVVRHRLYQAGVRLAMVLKECFD
jgi:hypothetical protein